MKFEQVKFGTLYINNVPTNVPTKPWTDTHIGTDFVASDGNGNMIDMATSNNATFRLGNSTSNEAQKITWNKITDDFGNDFLYSDRCLITNVHMSHLLMSGLDDYNVVTIDGQKYAQRIMNSYEFEKFVTCLNTPALENIPVPSSTDLSSRTITQAVYNNSTQNQLWHFYGVEEILRGPTYSATPEQGIEYMATSMRTYINKILGPETAAQARSEALGINKNKVGRSIRLVLEKIYDGPRDLENAKHIDFVKSNISRDDAWIEFDFNLYTYENVKMVINFGDFPFEIPSVNKGRNRVLLGQNPGVDYGAIDVKIDIYINDVLEITEDHELFVEYSGDFSTVDIVKNINKRQSELEDITHELYNKLSSLNIDVSHIDDINPNIQNLIDYGTNGDKPLIDTIPKIRFTPHQTMPCLVNDKYMVFIGLNSEFRCIYDTYGRVVATFPEELFFRDNVLVGKQKNTDEWLVIPMKNYEDMFTIRIPAEGAIVIYSCREYSLVSVDNVFKYIIDHDKKKLLPIAESGCYGFSDMTNIGDYLVLDSRVGSSSTAYRLNIFNLKDLTWMSSPTSYNSWQYRKFIRDEVTGKYYIYLVSTASATNENIYEIKDVANWTVEHVSTHPYYHNVMAIHNGIMYGYKDGNVYAAKPTTDASITYDWKVECPYGPVSNPNNYHYTSGVDELYLTQTNGSIYRFDIQSKSTINLVNLYSMYTKYDIMQKDYPGFKATTASKYNTCGDNGYIALKSGVTVNTDYLLVDAKNNKTEVGRLINANSISQHLFNFNDEKIMYSHSGNINILDRETGANHNIKALPATVPSPLFKCELGTFLTCSISTGDYSAKVIPRLYGFDGSIKYLHGEAFIEGSMTQLENGLVVCVDSTTTTRGVIRFFEYPSFKLVGVRHILNDINTTYTPTYLCNKYHGIVKLPSLDSSGRNSEKMSIIDFFTSETKFATIKHTTNWKADNVNNYHVKKDFYGTVYADATANWAILRQDITTGKYRILHNIGYIFRPTDILHEFPNGSVYFIDSDSSAYRVIRLK